MNLNNLDSKYFFGIDQACNDMLHLWANENNLNVDETVLSNPYSSDDKGKLQGLVQLDYLSQKHAHPTAKGHKDIANKLIEYMKSTRNIL
jgi:hypothetical protein